MESPGEWFILVILTVLVLAATELWRRTRALPPGPTGLPLLGYHLFLRSDVHIQLAELAKRYGDVFSFRVMGGRLVVVVNGSDAMREVFVERADEFIGRLQEYNSINFVDEGLAIGIAQTEGTDWKEKRRFFLSAAKSFGFGKTEFEEYIQENIQVMTESIRKFGEKSVDIFEEVAFVTGNAIFKIICGKQFSKGDPKFSTLVRIFDTVVAGAVQDFFLMGVFLRLYMRYTRVGRDRQKAVDEMNAAAEEIVDEHVRTYDPLHQRDFVDAYLTQMNALAEKNMLHVSSFSMQSLKSITMNMLMEGTDSTGRTIACLLIKLSHHLDTQKKAQKEIDEVVGHSRLPSWTDRQNTPYLEALILELYRTASFFHISPFYANFEETYIRGYYIPKRTPIMMNFWSFANDPKLFKNPSKFHPERFLGADGKRIKHENPVPFGIGKRSCIGEALAQMEVYLIISSLLKNFTLYPGETEGEIRAEDRND